MTREKATIIKYTYNISYYYLYIYNETIKKKYRSLKNNRERLFKPDVSGEILPLSIVIFFFFFNSKQSIINFSFLYLYIFSIYIYFL